MKYFKRFLLLSTAICLGPMVASAQEPMYIANASDMHLGNSMAITLGGGATLASGTLTWDDTLYARGGTYNGYFQLKRFAVDGGGTTTIASGSTQVSVTGGINVSGNSTLATSGNLTLLSTASGTARVEELTGGNSISGNVTVQRYIPGGRRGYRYFSHPFTSAQALSVLTDDIDITGAGGGANGFTQTGTNKPSSWWLDPVLADTSKSSPNAGWVAFSSANTASWLQYQGIYLMVRGAKGEGITTQWYTPSPVTVDMAGSVNQGQQVVTITKGPNAGYNLVGNPYPSAIDLMPAISTMNNKNGAAFWVWNTNQGTKGGYEPVLYTAPAYYLPSCSAFQVDVTASTTLNFQESHKVETGAALFKTTPNPDMLELHVYSDSGKNYWDKLYLLFDPYTADSLEQGDARKNINYDLNFSAYATGGQKLCVDSRPYGNGKIIPLNFDTKLQQQFEIKVAEYTIGKWTNLYLYDKYLNSKTLLLPGTSYKFDVTTDTFSAGDRFQLGIEQTIEYPDHITRFDLVATTHIPASKATTTVKIYPNPANNELNVELPVQNNGSTGKIMITDMAGRTVYTATAAAAKTTINVSSLAPGVYTIVTEYEGSKHAATFTKN